MSCVVYGCSNSGFATADPSVHYYVFPKHPVIAQQWIEASGWQQDQIDLNTAKICSNHFDEDSYTTQIEMIDYIACYTKVLKYDAVPTLYLPRTTQLLIKDGENDPHDDDLGEMIVFAVEEEETVSQQLETKRYIELQTRSAPSVEDKYKEVRSEEQLQELEAANKKLRSKVTAMEEHLKHLKHVLDDRIAVYRGRDLELSKLHQEYLKAKRSFLSLHDQRVLLAKVFSDSQIKILSGKKKIYWSDDDMAVGYTIRHLSNRRCYLYLTKKLNVPLPAVSSIKRWMTLKNASANRSLAMGNNRKEEEVEDSE